MTTFILMSRMNIAVVGTGANGAAIAADLIRGGLDVTLIDQWPENVAAIRERGIDVRMPEEQFRVPARVFNVCEVATLRERFDVILLLVKAYDTRWATQLMEPLLTPHGLLVGVQNGLTLDTIADVVGARRTLGSVIELGGAMFVPGVVQRDTPPSRAWFAVGACDHRTVGREQELMNILRHSGTVEVYPDIRAAKWMKLVVNAAEVAPSAILNLSLSEAIETPGVRSLMTEVGCEALSVVEKAPIALVPIFGLPNLEPAFGRRFIEAILDSVAYHFAQPASKTAVLQDWIKGRRSEVDDMNGAIVRKGAEISHPTPFNSHVLEIALRVEHGELTPGIENLDRLLQASLLDGSQDRRHGSLARADR
jgi:2-dehydropantoate 2-reductase